MLGITSETEINFQEENGRLYIVKASKPKTIGKFSKLRGMVTAKMSTDEIMKLTRESA
ncbi:MAG: AbrB/MazE/SpoVT family DNA-binding domain-containing protein [Proteobacteria bacterium]|nr:AbrB/MazE/SpoVT family DNA-binding domain-containing protein [Pseudomonadota bacterium]